MNTKLTRGIKDYVVDSTRKAASDATKIINTAEAYRTEVLIEDYPLENRKAACACCKDTVPFIDGVWDQRQYQFLREKYDINSEHLRVHPALWNNGTNNVLAGVFEVLPGRIYQVRGYDMANITFVKTNNNAIPTLEESSGANRWLVIDTLMSIECTRAALRLFSQYLTENEIVTDNKAEEEIDAQHYLYGRIVGMIVSHSHIDHYGGMSIVKSWFVSDAEAKRLNEEAMQKFAEFELERIDIPFILAPDGFFKHSISENVYVGNAMGRRAAYQYGSFIKPNYTAENDVSDFLSGGVSIGIGQGQSTGNTSIEKPTMEVCQNCNLLLDELKVEFQLTPGTEAPAEMNNYFHDYKALWLAENCNGTLHNLYTLRGAQIRDGKAWADYLMEAAVEFADEAQVIFQSHNWPHWGHKLPSDCVPENGEFFFRTDLRRFLIDTASIYKYINDQTLLYMNMGYKMNDVSNMLTLPLAMEENWCLKPFYGTPQHNAKAVYQRFLGWYDANPLQLEEPPAALLAQEQMRYMLSCNDVEQILDMVKQDILAGNYWIAAHMAHQVYLGTSNNEFIYVAKLLCADALEQLGYQCQSGTWRNSYLSAAFELRNKKGRISVSSGSTMQYMTAEMLFDYIAILFDGKLGDKISFEETMYITDEQKYFLIVVNNGCLLYHELKDGSSNTEIVLTSKSDLISLISASQGSTTIPEFAKKHSNWEKILSCMVNLQIDRFKYFDLISRRDSDVLTHTDSEVVDISEIVMNARDLLTRYSDIVGINDICQIEESDLANWQKYYTTLVEQSVILGENFFTTDETEFNLESGTMSARIYWYILHSLYSYIFSANTIQYSEDNIALKTKQRIAIMEKYISTIYKMSSYEEFCISQYDEQAMNFLDVENDQSSVLTTQEGFFKELCKSDSILFNCIEAKL